MKTTYLLLLSLFLMTTSAVAQEVNFMLGNAQSFLGTPYKAHTLDTEDVEELNFMCDEVDCTTLVECVLAMSLCPQQGNDMLESDYAENLQRIRYRNGVIDGYTSRLHYVADWINNGVRNGFMEDVTAQNSPALIKLNISYMSTHPDQYRQLANSKENVDKMKEYEKALSGQTVYWLPKSELPVEGLSWIKNGDIIALTSATPGLDVSHMGIAIYIKNNLCLLHASSKEGKVIVDKLSLNRMLERSKDWTGIRVIRMKN